MRVGARGAWRLVATALVPLLVGCAAEPVILRVSGPTMGTTFEVKWVGLPATREPGERVVTAELARFDAALSTWRADSAISAFNAHASTEPFEIEATHRELFLSVLRQAVEVAERTEGAFDPTIEPLIALLGFSKGAGQAKPSDAERAAVLAHVGWHKLEVLPDGHLQKRDPALAINVNALAPGAAADRISDALAAIGLVDSMVDIGGEIRCRGTKPGGAPWQIGIERPTPPGAPSVVHTVSSLTGGLATSGDYRNFRMIDGDIVHHILDPRTGTNVRHAWASVTVWADSAMLADALATACMVLGPEGAEPVLASYAAREVRALFLGVPDADGHVAERQLPAQSAPR